ncbi:MAG: ArsC/Spx/MgsR family protein [Flavobacteriales bacterium]
MASPIPIGMKILLGLSNCRMGLERFAIGTVKIYFCPLNFHFGVKKIYFLSTCSTCQQIMKETGTEGFELIDIRQTNILEKDLDYAKSVIGSYEGLFSRRAMKFREWGLHEKNLGEADYKKLILEEYTFLKRPVYFIGKDVFTGNTKATVETIKTRMGE